MPEYRPGRLANILHMFRLYQQQADDDGPETDGIGIKTDGEAPDAHDDAGQGRADNPCQVEDRGVQRDGVHQVLLADKFNDKGLTRRHVQGIDHAYEGSQHQDVPISDDTGGIQDCKGQGDDKGSRLREQYDAFFGELVYPGSGKKGEQKHRRELERTHKGQEESGTCQGIGKPGLRDVLHPGPNQGNAHAKPVVSEAFVLQGGKGIVQGLPNASKTVQ